MKRIFTYIILSIFLALTGSLFAQYEHIENLSEHIEKGKIRLKLKREVFQDAAQLKGLNVSDATTTSIGVASIDRIGDEIGITRIQRVFPFSLKNEPRHREYDLHLWLEVDYNSNVDVEAAVAMYQSTGEVEIAKPLFKKVRMDADQKPVKYTAGDLTMIQQGPVRPMLKGATTEVGPPNDPLFDQQWHYETNKEIYENGMDIEMLKGWSISSGDSSVIVAIVDGGIDVNHADLQEQVWFNEAELYGEEGVDDDQNGYVDDINGYNFVFGGAVTPHAHGTHVAGTVGATTNNGVGVAGVAGGGVTHTDDDGNKYTDQGVRMISCQVFDDRSATSGNFAAAIVYGADNGAVISQNSWNYTVPNYYEPEVDAAIKYFVNEAGQYEGSPMKGGVIFFSMGNTGSEAPLFPAVMEEVDAVAALGPEGYPAPYSTYGEWADIAAPGGDQYYGHESGVLSTLPYDDYGFFQGTSMACPHVSGVAALVLSKYGGEGMTPDELRNRVVNSTSRFVFDHQGLYGTGMLNAPNALANDEKIAPDAIDDLEATEIYHDEVRLQWTIPVDEDNFQPALIYLALSGTEITAKNFDLKPQIAFENPFDAGTTVQVNIGGLIKQTDYWFAIKTIDQFGNLSEVSNIIKLTTSDSPKFDYSAKSLDFTIDVSQVATHTETVQLSNVGEGLIYWQNYVENERYFWWLDQNAEEEKEEEEETTGSTYAAREVAARMAYAEAHPELFEVPAIPESPAMSLKSTQVVSQPTDYWDYDETIFTSGMSYENGQPAVSLLNHRNVNAGLVQATRFNVEYDYSFNLTHLEVAMYNQVNDKPIIVELRKGATKLEESESVYMQEYYADTTEVFGFQRIPLLKPHRFEDGDIFWVVLHFPKEDQMPLGLASDEWYPDLFLMSRDNGRSFIDLQGWVTFPGAIPLVRALSTGDDGAYVFLKPGKGEIAAGANQDVEVHVDASNLSEGRHLASVTLVTNDDNKPYVSMEVNVTVSGQQPQIDTITIHSLDVVQNALNELHLELENTGLATLEIYDIQSDDTDIIKNFNDTISLYIDYSTEIPFKYTPTHTGVLETKLKLVTNYGTIGLPVKLNSSAPAGMNASFPDNILNLAYGEAGTLDLSIHNDGSGSMLEYDLSHYSMLNKSRSMLPETVQYNIITSEDAGGPVEGTWEDISEIGTVYDWAYFWMDSLALEAKVPFFNEVVETFYHGLGGVIHTYGSREIPVQLPSDDFDNVGIGALAALMIDQSSRYFNIKEFIHHSYGDKNIFTITVKERILSQPNANSAELTYQVVVYRNGTIEYRYKDVSALTPDLSYMVAIQGFTKDDYAVYKNLDDTDTQVYDGLVVRFEPVKESSMILVASPDQGHLSANETATVSLSIDPEMYGAVAGTYEQSLRVKANIANLEEEIPFTVNITGASSFGATDTLSFETTNIGHIAKELIKVENTGSDKGDITSINFSDPVFATTVNLPYTINAKAHRFIPVEYSPETVGNIVASMTLVYSNGVSETVRLEGRGQVDPDYTHTIPSNIVIDVEAGEVASVPFSLSAAETGADLEYNFVSGFLSSVAHESISNGSEDNEVKADNTFGYSWKIDTNRVAYKWASIEGEAEVLDIKSGKQQAVALPFDFPFYGELFDTIWISKNGYVTVLEPTGEPYPYNPMDFQVDDGVAGMMAPFWANIIPDEGAGVWLKTETDRVVVEWNNYLPEDGAASGGAVTFQLEILKDGRIYFHYKDIQYWEGLIHYGIESPDETENISEDRTYILIWTSLFDERTVAFMPPMKSTLSSGTTTNLKIEVDGKRIFKSGSYRDTLSLLSNSSAKPKLEIPVTINFSGEADLVVTESLNWEEVVYTEGKTVRAFIEFWNQGSEKTEITEISGLNSAEFYDEKGDEIVIYSTGQLKDPVSIMPWRSAVIEVAIPINSFDDIDDSIIITSGVGEHKVDVNIQVVESPVFDWDATAQTFNINTTEKISFDFNIESKGQTNLSYKLIPSVIPTGDGGPEKPEVDEIGHYTFDVPRSVDSLAMESKETSDGGQGFGGRLMVCNEFIAPEGGFVMTHVKAWTDLVAIDKYVTVMVYIGGDDPDSPDNEDRRDDPQSGTKAFEQRFIIDEKSDNQWVVYPLERPVTIPEGERFYVMLGGNGGGVMGYENNTDQELQKRVYTAVHWEDDLYHWYSTVDEDWYNAIYKIRPVTAAGKGLWLELNEYSGVLQSGETANITATIDGDLAGPGTHRAKIIANSNDVNRLNSEILININVNGSPEVTYHPNVDADTLKVVEWDELLVNMMASDPEGDKLTFELIEDKDNPYVEFEQVSDNTIQMKLKTDYNGQGVYTYHVNIQDETGNTTRDSILVEVVDLNRAPYLNPDLGIIYLNMADPTQGYTIDGNELFFDEDGDELQILAGNYTPDIVDLALGNRFITINPLQEGTGFLAFAADDGKEGGFVVYGVYVVIINDPDTVEGSPNGIGNIDDVLKNGEVMNVMPNPVSNGQANIYYHLEEEGNVMLEIYDMTGKKCAVTNVGERAKGSYKESVNVTALGKGLYFCRFTVNGQLQSTEKLVINK
ncbi:MAG: S8 family serine peptidase [Bacteroidales bacterium]|nr:S8 family serine peptidase [Bacteroidales bacterium]